jgi:hypothetical protein
MRRESAARGSGCMKEMLGAVTTVSAGHDLSSTFQSILIETAGRTDRGGDHHRESSRRRCVKFEWSWMVAEYLEPEEGGRD